MVTVGYKGLKVFFEDFDCKFHLTVFIAAICKNTSQWLFSQVRQIHAHHLNQVTRQVGFVLKSKMYNTEEYPLFICSNWKEGEREWGG